MSDFSSDGFVHEGKSDEVLTDLFSQEGPFSEVIQGYKARPSQLEMAKSIANAIKDNQTLVAEAGTGTGKTFAYLIPTMMWGGKVILSTGTKNLQDQLFLKDIPIVRKVLNIPIQISLLKGRANYVCRFHLERVNERGVTNKQDASYVRSITNFAKKSKTGDKAELSSIPENAPIWNLVTSTRENCLGTKCAYYDDCFVMKARKEAQQADVVVVNHHLFFADLSLKDMSVAELLPHADTIIFDEAHQIPDTATLFFGETLSSHQLFDLCRETWVEGQAHARDAVNWTEEKDKIELTVRRMRELLPEGSFKFKINQIPHSEAFFELLFELVSHLNHFADVLETQAERTEVLANCYDRAREVLTQYTSWIEAVKAGDKTEYILWVESFGSGVQLHKTPLSIANIFQKQREENQNQSWIFTSATLAIRENFNYFTSQLGLESSVQKSWASPFQYDKQGLLFVPNNIPQPNVPHFSDVVVDTILPILEASEGRAFILCTTIRAVNRISDLLRQVFLERDLPYPLFVQGEATRTDLLNRFRESGNGVLVGSQSFWEGVDVRGEALSLVIVDKIPFAPPDDPVLEARIKALEQRGGNGFMDYQLPEAIMSLKQGVGRLIRDETDKGVLVICDVRLIDKRYGRQIWQSLPPFSRTRDIKVACDFFEKIKKEN